MILQLPDIYVTEWPELCKQMGLPCDQPFADKSIVALFDPKPYVDAILAREVNLFREAQGLSMSDFRFTGILGVHAMLVTLRGLIAAAEAVK